MNEPAGESGVSALATLAKSAEHSNIVDLMCVVVADGQWYLSGDIGSPVWSNKYSEGTAQRYPVRLAAPVVRRASFSVGQTFSTVEFKYVVD